MKIENFRSGQLKQQYEYKSFSPTPINQEWAWEDPVINIMLERATKAVSELNAYSLIVPNVDIFIRMHVVKEASQSSRIEGTKTSIEDALKDEDDIEPENRDDWQEVQNYIQAMNVAIEDLKSLPLSNRLLKKTHKILMQGVRGENKEPGEFRMSQNWIGGSNLKNAVFIPPHHEEVSDLMTDLEKFLHNDRISVPNLIRVALAHYQFETIHPFLDGNGRIGRLLITLYMVSTGFLSKPSLYLSDWLEQNKGHYYDALTTVRASNNLSHWIKFFLTAVIATAEKGKFVFQNILKIKQNIDSLIPNFGKSATNAKKLIEHLYTRPSINVKMAAEYLDITPQAANTLINEFVKMKILYEVTGYKRNRIFVFKEYLDLFRD